jgi:hypothetical protein
VLGFWDLQGPEPLSSALRAVGGTSPRVKCVPSPVSSCSIAWFLLCLCIAYGLLCHTLHPRTSRMERRIAQEPGAVIFGWIFAIPRASVEYFSAGCPPSSVTLGPALVPDCRRRPPPLAGAGSSVGAPRATTDRPLGRSVWGLRPCRGAGRPAGGPLPPPRARAGVYGWGHRGTRPPCGPQAPWEGAPRRQRPPGPAPGGLHRPPEAPRA